jgi:hypothetical protein
LTVSLPNHGAANTDIDAKLRTSARGSAKRWWLRVCGKLFIAGPSGVRPFVGMGGS